jgi:hypothetical protein
VDGFEVKEKQISGVKLGSGEIVAADSVLFADRWTEIAGLVGLPKGISQSELHMRGRNPVGVIQATWTHRKAIHETVLEGFFGTLHRESGETFDRHVLGYFSDDRKESYWTVCMGSEESEDNHEIAKKLRRIKQALNKMFVGPEWGIDSIPAGTGQFQAGKTGEFQAGKTGEFMDTVESEHVRFEERCLFSGGKLMGPVNLGQASSAHRLEGLTFLTDGYGISHSLSQVGELFPEASRAQAEDVNLPQTDS